MPKTFGGGIPVKFECDRLVARFQQMGQGDVIEHKELESIIGRQRITNRYRTVLTRARKQFFKERGVELQALTGTGLIFPANGLDQIRDGTKKIAAAGRRARKGADIIGATPDEHLDVDGRRLRDFLSDKGRTIMEYLKAEGRKICAVIGKTPVLPRPE